MADGRLDHIRSVYKREKEPFDALWDWARKGKNKRERYRRFRALERWAKEHAKHAKGSERDKWQGRRAVYARRKRRILTQINDAPSKLGTGGYAGSSSFIDIIIAPTYARHGIPPTSRKRWETFGNPGSDHWMGNRIADALDGGIANAQWLHVEIAAKFRDHGVPLSPTPRDYALCYCTANGRRYRFQGIAATHGTGPHYHSGVKLA